jgi:O-antigen ligase
MAETASRASYRDILLGSLAITILFAAPFSRSLFILSASLFCILWVLLPGVQTRVQEMLGLIPAPAALVLLTMVAIGSLTSHGFDWDKITNLRVYAKLLMMLMLAQVLIDGDWRKRATVAWCAGMAIVIVSTVLNVFIDLPWSKSQNQGIGADHRVFVDYVSQGMMTSIFSAFCLLQALRADPRSTLIRGLWWASAILAAGCTIFLLQGRSGVIALFVAIAFVIVSRCEPKHRITVLGLALLTLALIVALSPLMRARIDLAVQEVLNYKPFTMTSLGLRIDMWRLALETWFAHPWFGSGDGTYAAHAFRYFGHCNDSCIHPHNQYLFFAMEYGVVGLALYLWLLASLFRASRTHHNVYGQLLAILVLVIAVDGLYNVPLWYRAQSYFLYAVIGLAIAGANAAGQQKGKAQKEFA